MSGTTDFTDTEAKINECLQKIPSLPVTAVKIIQLANNIDSPPKEMLDTIKMDPVITGKVLELINSSYFGLRNSVSDLKQALVMLGANTIKNLALATALLNTMKGKSSRSELDLDALWLHSLGCAVSSKLIAREAGIPRMKIEEFFITGLLHDIGKIFIFQFLGDEYIESIKNARANGTDMETGEKNIMGTTHANVGFMLAQKWNLSELHKDAIKLHHSPSESAEFSKECAIINLANYYTIQNQIGWQDGTSISSPDDSFYTMAGVTKDQVEQAMSGIHDAVENAKSFIEGV